MTHEPFNDNPDHVPVQKWQPIIILWFLNFHRKSIIGALLIAAVSYLLIQLSHPAPVDESNATVAQVGDSTPPPAVLQPEPRPTEITAPVANATDPQKADQQINFLLTSGNNWHGLEPENAASVLLVRLELLTDLIDGPDLKPRQRSYCTQEYIKTIGLLSERDQKITKGIEGIDKTVAEVDRVYATSEDGETAALAKAVFVSHLARRFAATQSEQNFEAFEIAFSERRDAIFSSNFTKLMVTAAVRDTAAKAGDNPRLRELAIEHLTSVIYENSTAVVDLAGNLFFPEVDWKSLPSRINERSPGGDADFEILLDSLKKHPNTPLVIYSTVMSAISWYQRNGEADKAQQAIERIEAIAPNITLKRIQDEVLRGIKILQDTTTK